MQNNKEYYHKIRKESSDIAQYAGLVTGRLVLLACLCIVMFPLRPVSIYLIAICALFPWIFSIILSEKHPEAQEISLYFCAQKYRYQPNKFLSEKCTGYGIMILLAVWQFSIKNASDKYGIWYLAPAVCLLIYFLCRLISTRIFHRKVRQEYFEMKLLDE